MNAYMSTELSMIQMLDPQRHELALLQEAFLNKGGTIEVLQGPSFVPPPVRHEPPPTVKAKPTRKAAADQIKIDSLTQRDIDREERAIERAQERIDLIERIRMLAETMNYSQAILCTGMSRRTLLSISRAGDFKFQSALGKSRENLKPNTIDDAKDEKDAERIKAFMEIGISRNQAIKKVGISFKTFTRILAKFDIDYPKRRAGPHSAFFAKEPKQ